MIIIDRKNKIFLNKMNYVEQGYNILWKLHNVVHLFDKVLQVKIEYYKHNS